MAHPLISQAIAAAGGAAAIATELGISEWGVQKWAHNGLPATRVLWLAERTAWRYTPHDLAPALYPHPLDGMPGRRRRRDPQQAASMIPRRSGAGGWRRQYD